MPVIISSVSWVDVVSTLVLPLLLPTIIGLVSNSKWPTFWKRMALGGLTLITTVLTNLVESAVTGAPYDIGWGLIQFLATWGLAELAYYNLLKAPLEPTEPVAAVTVEAAPIPENLSKLTKAELIEVIEAAPVISVSEEPADAPKSIASIVAAHGVK